MASLTDIDWGGLISNVVQAGTQAYTGIMQMKAQQKAAKQAAKAMASFPMLGTGNMSLGYSQAVPIPMPGTSLAGMQTYGGPQPSSTGNALVDQLLGGLGFNYAPAATTIPARTTGAVYTCYTTPSGRSAVSGYRSLGHPLLWSGDLAAVKRVARVARKLGRFSHRRPH